MIWFKLEISNGDELNGSELITAKVTELLGTKELLYTGSHEIIEQEIMVEEEKVIQISTDDLPVWYIKAQ